MDDATVLAALGGALLAFAGVLVGSWVTRRGDREMDRWRRREESMRLLRWSVESPTTENDLLADAGLTVLDELLTAELLQPEDKKMVASVAHIVTGAARAMAYAGVGDPGYSEIEELAELREDDDA